MQQMLQTQETVNEGLIATLTNAHLFGEYTRSGELWTETRDLGLLASCPDNPLTRPLTVIKWLTREANHTRSTDTLNVYIAEQMSEVNKEVNKVERVYSNYKANVFYTWIVIEERDRAVQKAIYAREKQIIKRFSEMRFDFYIVYRSGADPETIISGVELVYDRDQA
jgi:hypothetical protein